MPTDFFALALFLSRNGPATQPFLPPSGPDSEVCFYIPPLSLTKASSVEKSLDTQYLPTKATIVASGKGVGVENQGEA